MRTHHALLVALCSSFVVLACDSAGQADNFGGSSGSSNGGSGGSSNGGSSSSGAAGSGASSNAGTAGSATGGDAGSNTGATAGTSNGGTAGAPGGSGGVAGSAAAGAGGSMGGSNPGGSGGTGATCGIGMKDCNNDPADGCEINTSGDVNNCGDCGNVCPTGPDAPAVCYVGNCGLDCPSSKGNCNNDPTDGCEADLNSDDANCGSCGLSCGGQGCISGSCVCAAENHNADKIPLDIFIMLDQSGSMSETVAGGGTRWDAVTAALNGFIDDPANVQLSVGIQYFALADSNSCSPTCTTNADCGAFGPCFIGLCLNCVGGGESCNPADYAVAEVEIAQLSAQQRQALHSSIAAHSPSTNTPTAPALDGAIQHAKAWKSQHPGHEVVVIFATDGDPTECDPTDIPSIAAIAAAGVNGTPSVRSFVIGVGSLMSNLNEIAAGGGTGQAFIVDTNGNVAQQFQAALDTIQAGALGCEYSIPQPMNGPLDYSKINVQYTPSGGSPGYLNNVADEAACDPVTGGWYYDNNAAPTKIIICEPVCAEIKASNSAEVDVLLGCDTKHE